MENSWLTLPNDLSNSRLVTDRIRAVVLYATATQIENRLGRCYNCKHVSEDHELCTNENIKDCNVFTNSLYEPIIYQSNDYRCPICGDSNSPESYVSSTTPIFVEVPDPHYKWTETHRCKICDATYTINNAT